MIPVKFPLALSFDDVLVEPKHSNINHRADISLNTSVSGVKLEIPIVSANMSSVTGVEMAVTIANCGGLGLLHRMYSCPEKMQEDLVSAIQKYTGKGAIGFSFGIGENWEKYLSAGLKSGAHIGCLDVAHADHQRVHEIIPKLSNLNFPIIIGNIATYEAAQRIVNIWVSESGYASLKNLSLKVGIGGGSLCTTRIMTGCGLPTFQSVLDIAASVPDVSIIADGGIRSSGDIVKCLGAGSNAVMLGSMLAGTSETPGEVIAFGKEKSLHKVYRGSASFGDKKSRGENTINIEGTETLVHYKGSVVPIIGSILDGIRSGCSYVGASSIGEIYSRCQFVQVTTNGLRENHPHGL